MKIDESARSNEEGLCIYNLGGTKKHAQKGSKP